MRGRKIGMFCSLLAVGMMSLTIGSNLNMRTVCAGDINGAESMIINFYNGTFQYQGKTYVATEEAKAATYSKLVQDGVDLTYSEARTAIAQANSQIADGIAQGILVEVNQDTTDDSQQENGGSENSGESSEDNSTSSDTNSSNAKDDGKAEKSGDTKQDDTAGQEKKKETNKKDSDRKESAEIVDIDKLIKDAAQNPNRTTVVRQEGNKYQVIDFETGEQLEVASDGTVLSHSEIPFKASENALCKLPGWMWMILFTLLAILFAIGIIAAFRKKKSGHRSSRNKTLRTIYSVMDSVVIYVCVGIAFGTACLYVGYAEMTGIHMVRIIGVSFGIALAFGVVLWMLYHYKHRAVRYVAYALAAATVTDVAVVVWLLHKQWVEQSSFLIIGIEALLTIVCFRMVSLLKQKGR